MYVIDDKLNALMNDKRPLDLIKTKNTHSSKVEDIIFFEDDLITYNGDKTFSIFSQYGIQEDVPNNTISFLDIDTYGDMVVIGTKLIVFGIGKVGISNINVDTNGNNILSEFNITNIPTGNFHNIKLKVYKDDIIYFKSYNRLIVYELSSDSVLFNYNAGNLILDAEIVHDSNGNYEALISLETKGKSQLYLVDISRHVEISNNIHLPLSEEFPNDEYLGYINFIKMHGDYIYTTQYNGYVYRAYFDRDNGKLESFKLFFKATGYTERIKLTNDFMFIINGYDDLYAYNLFNGDEELIEIRGSILELASNDIIMAVLYDSGNPSYRMINYYSLLNEFPSVRINNVKLERREILDSNGKHTGDYNYYNGINLMITDTIPNRVSKIDMDVRMTHSFFNDISIHFDETNNPKNIYVPIIDKSGNDIVNKNYTNNEAIPSSLSIKDYSTIFSNIPPELSGNNTYNFSIIDNRKNIDFINVIPRIDTGFYNDLNLINFKDFYFLNGYIYFRMRLLSKAPNMIVTVGTLDDNSFNGNVYYNKEFDPVLEGKIRNLEIDKNIYSVRNIHTNLKELDKENELDNIDITIDSLYTHDKPIYQEYNWFRMKYSGDTSNLKELPIHFSVGYLDGYEYYDITYEDNLVNIVKDYQRNNVELLNHRTIKSSTFDGDIKLLEEMYISRSDVGDKSLYLDNMSNISFEKIIPKNAMKITDRNHIVNGETVAGYMLLPLEYDSYQYKSNSLLGEVYVNGKKAFNKFIRLDDIFNGIINIYYPTEALRPLLSESDYALISKDKTPNAEVTGVLRKRKLINSEDHIVSHTINNTYQNEVQLLQTNGIYFNLKISDYMSSDRFRVFIKGRKQDLFARINPDKYHITLDREYGQLLLKIPSASYIKEGMTIMIVSNGVTDRTIFYDKLSDLYDIDSVPLLQTTNDNYLMMSGKRTDDVDINVNGYTLVPNIDFTIIDDLGTNENPLSLAVFRNLIPQDATMEINFLDEGKYHTRFFPNPAVGTEDIFVMEDDFLVFRENMFEVFANNLRIPKEDITVIDAKTIRIETNQTDLINVMVRFSFNQNHNLPDIFSNYKLSNYNNNQTYYHSMINKLNYNSNFDILCDHKKSTSISKLTIRTLLEKIKDGTYTYIEDTKIDANDDNGYLWDINVDSSEINSQYIKDNLFIRSNVNWKKKRSSNNPEY